jgi:secreted trypsin-like serine protease
LKELFAAYVEAKQKQNVLDYDDLMLYWAQPRALPPQAAIARLAASSTRSGSACSSDVAVGMPGHVLKCQSLLIGSSRTAIGADARMSLQSATFKIDALLQGAALLLTFGIWAAYGFPFIPELVALGCLVIVCIVVIHWWMTSRLQKEK